MTFLGPAEKVRKSPLPSDAVDRIARVKQEPSDADRTYIDNFPYGSLLGALLYLSMNTRPDIAYAVGLLLRFGSKSTLTTCHLMTYLMRYVRGTVSKGIQFRGSMFDMPSLQMQTEPRMS